MDTVSETMCNVEGLFDKHRLEDRKKLAPKRVKELMIAHNWENKTALNAPIIKNVYIQNYKKREFKYKELHLLLDGMLIGAKEFVLKDNRDNVYGFGKSKGKSFVTTVDGAPKDYVIVERKS